MVRKAIACITFLAASIANCVVFTFFGLSFSGDLEMFHEEYSVNADIGHGLTVKDVMQVVLHYKKKGKVQHSTWAHV